VIRSVAEPWDLRESSCATIVAVISACTYSIRRAHHSSDPDENVFLADAPDYS